jgi:hypothetical protein
MHRPVNCLYLLEWVAVLTVHVRRDISRHRQAQFQEFFWILISRGKSLDFINRLGQLETFAYVLSDEVRKPPRTNRLALNDRS